MLDEVSETMAHKEFNMPHILSVRGLILVVEDRLTEIYLRELFSDKDGSWVETCSGKEVYDTICQTMFQDVAHKRDDFAKAIAESQRADSMLPKDMIELHDVLFGVHAKLISVNG